MRYRLKSFLCAGLLAALPAQGTLPAPVEDPAAKAKREEILETNRKNQVANEIVKRTFLAGNAALLAKNYDEAIKQYDEGLAAEPEQSALMINKALALKARGVERYNAAIAAKSADRRGAQVDFRAAVDAANKAVELGKAAPADPAGQALANANKLNALKVRAEAMRLFVTKVDPAQVDAGRTAYREYLAAKPDPVKKLQAQHELAQMLFDLAALAEARAEYEKILADNPEDLDALSNLGLILYTLGATDEGDGKNTGARIKYQAAADYLQHFVDQAPDTNRMKPDAMAILDDLRDRVKVKPEKPALKQK